MELELKQEVEVVTVVGKDGRMTIPVKIRELLDIKQGDAIRLVANESAVVMIVLK